MSTTLFHPDHEVIDCFYIVSTIQFGRHLLTGKPLDITTKGKLVRLHAEPVVESRTGYVQNKPIEVLVPMVTVVNVDRPEELYVVVYDEHYVVRGENYQLIHSLTAEAQRRPNAYDPLTRI